MDLANQLSVLSGLCRFLLWIESIVCWIENGSGVERYLKDYMMQRLSVQIVYY